MSDLEVTQQGFLRATVGTTVDFNIAPGCVYDTVDAYHIGGNLSVYSFSFNLGQTSTCLVHHLSRFNVLMEQRRTINCIHLGRLL